VRQADFGGGAAYEEEGLRLRREIGDKWGIAVSLANFAWIALHQDDIGKAGTLLMESLALRREIEDRGGMAWCIEKLAKINILYGQKKSQVQAIENFRRAARLFGAAAALRAPVGSVIDQADQSEYDRDLEVLRKALGKETFLNFWLVGEDMPLDEVIDEAFAESTKESMQSEKEKSGGLTGRERQVAILISQGKSNREIAKEMTIGIKTVETYVTRILNKLGFDSRVQIATWAIEKRIAVPDKS
jgi:non-specific serine/threonine protein kinase